MKRIVAIMLAFVMALSLCACDHVPPEMSKDTYKVGKKALEVMDKHLAGGIDAAEAEKQLTAVYGEITAVMNSIHPDPSSSTYAKDYEYAKTAKSVEYSIKNFVLGLRGEEDSLGKVPDLQKSRDFLYSTLTGADMNKG
ncbi:MAG: hypothetical protein IKC24_07170 [Oscillospiraceae bacterium]|nr:hypothetical protein [Oscillospiraceae bacterium]